MASRPPKIRVSTQVPFPAMVRGSGPVTIAKASGVWTVGFSVAGLNSIAPPIASYATDFLFGWDTVNKQFFQISLTNVLAVPVTSPPVTETLAYAVGQSDSSIILNNAGGVTLTLPAAAQTAGRWLYVRTIAAGAVASASANVVPLAGGAAGTAILAATAGKWAAIQSDGTNWQVMMAN